MKNNITTGAIAGPKQNTDELHLLYSITRSIIESGDFNSALEVTLKKICRSTGWVYGEVWIPDEDKKYLEYGKVWYSNIKEMERFRLASENFKFPHGIGLPGRIWSSRKPEWKCNITLNAHFLRKQLAMVSGLKSAVGIPIISDNEVSAVMIFFTSEILKKDRKLIELISTIAFQLGTFLKRKKIEELLYKSEKEIRTIMNLPAASCGVS